MNRLSVGRRCAVVRCLVEGVSVRGTARLTGVSKPTILRLLVDLGAACAQFLDRELRALPCRRIQCDEMWSFVYAKQKRLPPDLRKQPGYGDSWLWLALDPDTKLIAAWLVGERTLEDAHEFMRDLASRLRYRVQLTTDAFGGYPDAVDDAFVGQVDFATTTKDHRQGTSERHVIQGSPNPAHISTSLVERQNLSIRMENRRFARLTNAHSKKLLNHACSVALHVLHHNFARPHEGCGGVSPAQATGLTYRLWKPPDIVALLAEHERPIIQKSEI